MKNKLYGNVESAMESDVEIFKKVNLAKLISPEEQGAPFSYNLLTMEPGGLIPEQIHEEQHVIFLLQGKCRLLLGKVWSTLEKNSFAYIPSNLPHSFQAEGDDEITKILILKN